MEEILKAITTLCIKVDSMDNEIQKLKTNEDNLKSKASQQHDYKNAELRRSKDGKNPELKGDDGKLLKTHNICLNTAAEPIAQPPFQQLLMCDQRSFGEGSSSQRHVDNSPREYEGRENETNVDPYSDVNAEISEESSEEDEPSKDDGESESDEDINDARDFSQNDIGINLPNQFERDVSEVQNHDVPYFRTLDNEEDVFMSTCESEMEYCSVWSEDATKDLKKGMFFSSKEELKRAMTIWSLKKNKEFKVMTSNKSLWVVRCKFHTLLGCLWFLRGRKVGDNLWKIGKYIENHRCETEGLSRGHANLNTNLIASLILNQIQKNPKVLVVDVISKVHEKFGHQITYRKAWLGRQRAFELVYGDFKKSFSDLPKFFAAFQHFNHGTVVEWKHEESMSSLEDLSRLMWRAASAHQVRKFESLIWQIREENEETYEYLMEMPLDKWTVSHDGGKRWGVLTTNLSESFNGVLKKVRGLPVTAMVRLSLEQTVERYTRRSQKAQQLLEQDELWTERFKMKWEKNYESSKRHFVFYWNIPTGVCEVRSIQVDGNGGNPHCVSLNERKCDCGKWVNLHFPCSHVMKVTDRMGGLARNFVSEHFTVENYVATYFGSFSPVGHEAYWPSPNFRMESNKLYRRLNRSRKTRIPNEMDRGATVYERACGLCRQTGHDRRRCPDRN
ncbi:hypothetical protein KY290_017321 [Solanum tuberosum]|uniref:SWIM-type domain-containing protein n=1 Tax=Solanum tuberosum TaxID=4113 RepID=A0ABQ7VBU5_SOLTU|nr:hypothetical protein KY284_019050 [Solanum tuberosum]KAH0702065.1 hypothetical protein KY285_016343 [Solanum tuberosum]KAH0761248.1 hypothetical protein KY290_017321 [Solanum tuberosum]